MHRLCFFAVLLIVITSHFGAAQQFDSDIADYSDINALFYPNDEGSPNEINLIRYICNYCQLHGITYKTQHISGDDYSTLSENVILTVGDESSRDNLLYVTPLNTAIKGRQLYDNSVSIRLMLGLAAQASKMTDTHKQWTFLFAGASNYDGQPYYGIEHFLDNTESKYSFVTVIDILSIDKQILMKGGGNIICEAARRIYTHSRISDIAADVSNINDSKSLARPVSDFTASFASSSPVILFSNREELGLDEFRFSSEYQNRLDTFFAGWNSELSELIFPIRQSDNYAFFRLFGQDYIIRENIILFILIFSFFVILASRLLIPNIRRIRLSIAFGVTLRFLPLLPAYYILSFIPYLASLAIGSIFGNQNVHLTVFIFYLLTVFFVSAMIFFIIRDRFPRFYMMRHSYMFIAAAIVYSFVDLFLFGMADIMLTFIYIWAIIMITCSNFTGHNYRLKFIFYILSCVPYLFFVGVTMPHYIRTFPENVLSIMEHVSLQNALITISTFPFMLLYMRLDSLVYYKIHFFNKRNIYRIVLAAFFIGFTIIVLAAANISRDERRRIDVTVDTDMDAQHSTVSIDSQTKQSRVFISDGESGSSFDIPAGHTVRNIAFQHPPYSITSDSHQSGSFTNYVIRFHFDYPVTFTDVTLSLPTGYYPFETNYPFRMSDSMSDDESQSDSYSFILPRNMHYASYHAADSDKDGSVIRFSVLNGVDVQSHITVRTDDDSDFQIDFTKHNVQVHKTFVWRTVINF